MLDRFRRFAVGGLAIASAIALTLVTWPSAPAGAAVRNPIPANSGSNTQMTVSSLGAGQAVSGFIANPTNPFDPVLDGYTSSDPTTGFTPKDEGFAGVIHGTPTGGGPTLSLYCFDILTDTWVGVGYVLGTWDAANVPNVGYVARILNEYYPFVPDQPSGLANTNQMAAAVQAAIWFFSDRYVLSTSDPLHDTVAAIVAHIIDEGPVVEPPAPSLSITPTDASGPSPASVVGPFTVDSDTGSASVTATGADMFADAGATMPILNGTTVTTPKDIWLRSTGPLSAVLQATATAHVPRDNVYLYDGNSAGVGDAQKLILAQDASLSTTVSANAEFKPVGSLTVTKTIAGSGARRQGQVVIHTVCDGTPLIPDFVIASGTAAGSSSRTYTGIPAGSICTVTETANGQTASLAPVEVTGDGQQVTIPAGSTITANLTDTYTLLPGSLDVTKLVTGIGAGRRGPVTITVTCNGVARPDYVIPASADPADVQPMHYDDIPANASCTVSELSTGANSEVNATVTATVNGTPVTLPATVTVPSATHVELDITDDYGLNPGRLVVTKTIGGSGAGTQGEVVIHTVCDGTALTPDFVIAPGTAAGTSSMGYDDIPADAVCTVTETSNGSTSTVAVSVTGDDGANIPIPAGGTADATITDTYTSSGLVVNKTITGDGAGLQGTVTITVSCVENGVPTTLPPFVVPAGTPAGTASMSYTDIPVGSPCTVTETGDGGNPPSLTVVTTGSPSTVTVDPVATVDIGDTYTLETGSLVVTKHIAGPQAGTQAQVEIEVSCDGVPASQTPTFVIPAGTTGSPAQTYPDIPAGTQCLVSETVDGSTSSVQATVSQPVQSVTVAADQTATASITDTYTAVPGSLIVGKVLTGPLAGQQGAITFTVLCGTTSLPSFVIPAGSKAGIYVQSYDGIPAGSQCTATETADGETSVVTPTVLPDNTQTVTIPAGSVVPVGFADVLADSPGTLIVTKNITGPAAGQEGGIALLVDCGQPLDQYAFLIPADTPAGPVSRSFPGLPAGSTCTVTETSNGATSTVAAALTSGQPVTIQANQTATVTLTDTFVQVAAEATTTPLTLATTGAGRPIGDLELGAAAIAAGALLLAVGAPRRYRARRYQPRHRRRTWR